MKPEELLSVLHTANRLKDTSRHCWTPGNRHESVADHSWRLALTAFFLRDEFPETDMDKVHKNRRGNSNPIAPQPGLSRFLFREKRGILEALGSIPKYLRR